MNVDENLQVQVRSHHFKAVGGFYSSSRVLAGLLAWNVWIRSYKIQEVD